MAAGSANIAVKVIYDVQSGGIALVIQNQGSNAEKLAIFDAYSGKTHTRVVQTNGTVTFVSQLQESFTWYDLTVKTESDPSFQRQIAGHVETGRPSMTDPAIAGGAAEAANAA